MAKISKSDDLSSLFDDNFGIPEDFEFEEIEDDPAGPPYDPAAEQDRLDSEYVRNFARMHSIPYFRVDERLVARVVNNIDDMFADEEPTGEKPVSLLQSVPKPTVEVVCDAQNVWSKLIQPMKAYATEFPERLDGSSYLRKEAELLIKRDFTPSDPEPLAYEVKKSTIGPALAALTQQMYPLVQAAPEGSTFKVLAEGCGNGRTDVNRICQSFDACGGKDKKLVLEVDLHDPIVEIAPDARTYTPDRRSVPGYTWVGKHVVYPPSRFKVIFCCNSFHYAATKWGGEAAQLDNLVASLEEGGVIVGHFPELYGVASINGPPTSTPGINGVSRHVQLLEHSYDRHGRPVITTSCFNRIYQDPVIDIRDLEEYCSYKLRSDCMVYNNEDVAIFCPDIPAADLKRIAPYSNERKGWSTAVIKKRSILRDFVPIPQPQRHLLPEIVWQPGKSPEDPLYCCGAGYSALPKDVVNLMNHGPFITTFKSDGYPAVCHFDGVEGRMTLWSAYGWWSEIVPDIYRDGHDYHFQLEFADPDLSPKVSPDVVPHFVQMFQIDGRPVTLGYGHSYVMAQKGIVTIFACFGIKAWSIFTEKEEYNQYLDTEGMVVQRYNAPPPPKYSPKTPDSPQFVRTRIECYYVKPKVTVDIQLSQFKRDMNFPERFVYKFGNFKVPFPDINPLPRSKDEVYEFDLEGNCVRKRPDKKAGNSKQDIAQLRTAIKFEEAVELLLSNYRRYQPETVDYCDFVITKNKEDWTVKELLQLAISYPKGINLLKSERQFTEISKMRLKLYRNPNLHTYLDHSDAAKMFPFRHQ